MPGALFLYRRKAVPILDRVWYHIPEGSETMRYDHISRGTFLARPNRFIAHVEVEGGTEVCHVKNTGRCRELLMQLGNPDALVLVAEDTAVKVKDLLPFYWQEE